jgi:uncharacterized protein (DUF427 family)
MKAIWNGEIIAESNETILLEGNYYFPPDSVRSQFLENSKTKSACPKKGTASYRNIIVGEKRNKDAAWFYSRPKEVAKKIKGYFAFWNGVEIVK